MSDIVLLQFNLVQLSQAVNAPTETIIEIIEQGIIEPQGTRPEDWLFNGHMISLTQKALRLHRDLDIEWSGIALAISLIEELDQLREDNRQLRQRLSRFLID